MKKIWTLMNPNFKFCEKMHFEKTNNKAKYDAGYVTHISMMLVHVYFLCNLNPNHSI